MKSTFTIVNGEERNIFKDPKTDSGNFKKSQTGLVFVTQSEGQMTYIDNLSMDEYAKQQADDLLEVVFVDGTLVRDQTLSEVRAILLKNL